MFVKNRLSGNRKPVLFLGNLLTKQMGLILCVYTRKEGDHEISADQ